jgi:hypothetical protein
MSNEYGRVVRVVDLVADGHGMSTEENLCVPQPTLNSVTSYFLLLTSYSLLDLTPRLTITHHSLSIDRLDLTR